MNILLTNDDGFEAPGLEAAYTALASLGNVFVVAPHIERSACSHSISLHRPISVQRVEHGRMGYIHAVDGTPADCVRLAISELLNFRIDLVVSGINRGANTGVDTFYSGTVAAAREAAILGYRAFAVSHAVRSGHEIDWAAAAVITNNLLRRFHKESLPGPGFHSINLPSPLPQDADQRVHLVPIAAETVPLSFERRAAEDAKVAEFAYGKDYWNRPVTEPTDFSVVRDGGIAVSTVPLFGSF